MNKIGAWVKAHKKEALIGGVAIAAAAFFLIKRGSGGSSASTPGVGTLTYNTTSNPVITRILKVPTTVIEKVPMAHQWGHYNFLAGERRQLENAMQYERGWLAKARAAGNHVRVTQLTDRLKFQSGTLSSLNSQIHNAWLKAKK